MNKIILSALPLLISSAASAYYYNSGLGYGPGYGPQGNEEIHINFIDSYHTSDRHCLYVNIVSSIEGDKEVCSEEGALKLIGSVERTKGTQALIKVKNKNTDEYSVNGSLYFNVYQDGRIELDLQKNIDDLSITQTNNNYFEFKLNQQEAEPETGLILYSEEHFQGKSLVINESQSDLGDFALLVDSYQVPEGWSVRFFEGKDFTGGFYTRGVNANGVYIADASDFSPRVQSVKILRKN